MSDDLNNNIWKEMLEIAREEKTVTTKEMTRLLVAGMIDIRSELKNIRKNPAVKLGEFVEEHPKTSLFLITLFLVLIGADKIIALIG